MLMHYKLFPIGGVICLMLCGCSSHLQVDSVGVTSHRAIWEMDFQTSYWCMIITKKIVFGIQTVEGKFPAKGSKEDSGIATGIINGDLKAVLQLFVVIHHLPPVSQRLRLGRSCGHNFVTQRRKITHGDTSGFLHSKNPPSSSFRALLKATGMAVATTLLSTYKSLCMLKAFSIPHERVLVILWCCCECLGLQTMTEADGDWLGYRFTEHLPWEPPHCLLVLPGKHELTAVGSFPSTWRHSVWGAAAVGELEFTISKTPQSVLMRLYPVIVLPSTGTVCTGKLWVLHP